MNRKHTLVTGVILLALGGATAAWSQSVPIASAPNPPADAVAIPAGSKERALRELPQIIADIMQRSQVPGMAVAVVIDGKTVLAQGYGTREAGKQAPVDAQTVFQIASISKSLSATVAAIEVSKGRAAWDDPVSRYLPDFKLSNAYVSERATIGDFFAHRSGLPGTAGDDLEDLGFSRDDVIARLRLLPLDAFRTSYHYANFSTTIGAQAVAKAAGRPWEQLADEQLFKPLGMKSTSYRYGDFEARGNRAVLHAYQNGRFVPTGQRDADQQAPAGGVSSTVVDLAEWLKLLLADGQYQGKTLIAPGALLPALSPQAYSARAHDLDSRSGFYGYGFNVNTELGGRPSMGHSGAFLMGTGTTFRIVPSAGIGIVVLTNGAPVGAAESVAASFTDTALYGKPTRDWFAAYNGAMKAFFEPQADLSGQADPAKPAASKALSQYAGRFDNPYYGPAEIQEANGALTLVLGPKGMRFPLRHWDGDTYAFSPAGEAELVASLASIVFKMDQGRAQGFDIKFYDDNGLGRWVRK
ncbi:serine hydrolase [Achromobacter aegrifaciens]|uniref:D-alanyl-D-alanine-carboxypeptidase/endopeptidase AmpH n=1 Tax=Achromobacter aegrifaciens TaxID=1287736 RepID=A0AAD2QCX9_ACHAE|nr:serine hydrolase [Achromobacter aegrifaciens]RSF03803.1 serine hydrolase [Achromobacter aegrifaciens]CAB3812240.1 D-aminopeptidase [Achromobacter aegrifaciens]CUI72361.1 D-alanyl-D-alanine-carboxypeptidase/endopeptidaseAmpH precursor [Achromobacter aegrifaciens]